MKGGEAVFEYLVGSNTITCKNRVTGPILHINDKPLSLNKSTTIMSLIKVIGIDPAPSKNSTFFDGETFHSFCHKNLKGYL